MEQYIETAQLVLHIALVIATVWVAATIRRASKQDTTRIAEVVNILAEQVHIQSEIIERLLDDPRLDHYDVVSARSDTP